MAQSSRGEGSKPATETNNSKILLTKAEYEARYGDQIARQERERNIQLLIRLRPGVFTGEEQEQYEELRGNITNTAWFAAGAFVANSAFRYWQIKTANKSVLYGLTAIFVCYAPAMIYYKLQIQKESAFIRSLSEKYRDRIDDGKLVAFIDTLPKEGIASSFFSANKQ